MKKLHTLVITLLLLNAVFFISCNKSTDTIQTTDVTENGNEDFSGRPHHQGGHGGGHWGGGHHGGHHGNCDPNPPNCPASVPTATGIAYTFSWMDLQHITIEADITYFNPDAAGSFRCVLRTVDNDIDSVVVIPAVITPAGQPAIFHLTFNDLLYEMFPCTLTVNGRPFNLQQCPERSRISFPINFNVSKG